MNQFGYAERRLQHLKDSLRPNYPSYGDIDCQMDTIADVIEETLILLKEVSKRCDELEAKIEGGK